MITRNTLYKFFQDFATNHRQIFGFGYGDLWEIATLEREYLLMWVVPIQSQAVDNEVVYNYTIYVGDRVLNGRGNAVEVESDTFQICQDLLATIDQQSNTFDWELDRSSVNLTPFREDGKDNIDGWLMDISIKANFTYDECAVPTTGTPTPPETSCPDATIRVNSVVYGTVQSGAIGDVTVKYVNGTLVGSLVGGIWTIPNPVTCDPASISLNTISFGTIAAGGSLDIDILNTDAQAVGSKVGNDLVIGDSAIQANGLPIVDLPAEQPLNISVLNSGATPVGSVVAGDVVIGDSVAVLKNSAGTTILSENIPAEQTENITAPDATAVIKDSAGATLKTEPILSGASENITINDSTVNAKNSLGTTIGTTTVKAENTADVNIADLNITVNSASFGSTPAEVDFNVVVKDTNGTAVGSKVGTEWIVPAGASASGVLFDTPNADQYTSYRTGDVGSRVQTGWFPAATKPTYPAAVAELDYTSANYFYLLKNNLVVNGVSSKTRFVDVDGGQTWSATGNRNYAVLCKLTGLLFIRDTNALTSYSWNNAIDNALTNSIVIAGVTYSDWYLATVEEAVALFGSFPTQFGWNDPVTSKQISYFQPGGHWLSRTDPSSTTDANYIQFNSSGSNFIFVLAKTTATKYIWIHKAHNLISAP